MTENKTDEKNFNDIPEDIAAEIKAERDVPEVEMDTSAELPASKFSFEDAGAKAGAAMDAAAEKGAQFAKDTHAKVKSGLAEHGIDTEQLGAKIAEDAGNAAEAVKGAASGLLGKIKSKLDEIQVGVEEDAGSESEPASEPEPVDEDAGGEQAADGDTADGDGEAEAEGDAAKEE